MKFPPNAGSAWALLLLLCACTARSPHEAPPQTAPYDRGAAVASFDSAWSRIGATYYDTTFGGLDWSALRDSLRPQAERARSRAEARKAIEGLFSKLGESHFAIIPTELASSMAPDSQSHAKGPPGQLGIDLRFREGRVLISRVMAGSSAERAGVRAGWELLRIGSLDMATMVAAASSASDPRVRRAAHLQVSMRATSAAFGTAGEEVSLVMRDGHGAKRVVTLAQTEWKGEIVRYGPLPPQRFSFEHHRYTDEAGCTGVIRFSVWMTPLLPHLERAMGDLKSCRGIVLDLRGNSGGIAALVMGASGFFVDEPVSLGSMITRAGTLRYMANPRRSNRQGQVVEPFAGPVAILIDPGSASTTEIFAKGMHDIGRARLFGDTTAGQALPATLTRLPDGDLLLHVIADFKSPNGTRLEARGVIPDVVLPLRRSQLLAGVDAPMSAAMEWIAGHRSAASAATSVSPHP